MIYQLKKNAFYPYTSSNVHKTNGFYELLDQIIFIFFVDEKKCFVGINFGKALEHCLRLKCDSIE